MVIDRRHLLAGTATALGALAFPAARCASAATEVALFAANRKSPDGTFSTAIFTSDGRDVHAAPLPARGHGLCARRSDHTCVAFARRPGNFAVAFSADRSASALVFTTPADRHFYGHGVFSHDGRLLFATENDFGNARGCLGIYDATAGWRRIGEFSTYGVGPHDVTLSRDGRTLIVANGGIETHPDIGAGRTKLNLATMEPSVAYVDAATGDLVERHGTTADLSRLSLRHVGVGARDIAIVGGQLETDPPGAAPLVMWQRRGKDPEPLALPEDVVRRMRGYVSGVSVDASGEIAGITAARGGIAVFVDVASGRYLGLRELADVAGIAPATGAGSFLLTSGNGDIALGSAALGPLPSRASEWLWDNHAVRI